MILTVTCPDIVLIRYLSLHFPLQFETENPVLINCQAGSTGDNNLDYFPAAADSEPKWGKE